MLRGISRLLESECWKIFWVKERVSAIYSEIVHTIPMWRRDGEEQRGREGWGRKGEKMRKITQKCGGKSGWREHRGSLYDSGNSKIVSAVSLQQPLITGGEKYQKSFQIIQKGNNRVILDMERACEENSPLEEQTERQKEILHLAK